MDTAIFKFDHVVDDGRNFSGYQEKTGRPAVETVFTVLHAGGKFGGSGYKVSVISR